jgi:acyl-coenzyme A thioesterase PaaI-like protein
MNADSYRRSTLSAEQAAEYDRVFGDLAERTRAFMDAALLTEVDADEVAEVADALDVLTRRLGKTARTGAHGVEIGADGRMRNVGNAVVGVRNPIAPPLHVHRSAEGRARSSFRLGALYEGPPGLVHGGISALILDQVCGEAAAAAGAPGMTGRLVLRYRRPTPLGDLSAEAWVDRVEGPKTTVLGVLRDPEGNPCVEAEGLFVLPRWARESLAAWKQAPPGFE